MGYWNTEKGEIDIAEGELATLWCTSEETQSRKAQGTWLRSYST